MISLLLDEAAGAGGMGWFQWVAIGLIVLLLIAYPLLMSRRNKAENKKLMEQTNSLKKGDEIITNAGVYGKVIEIKQEGEAKKVIIETGNDKFKSYMTIDAYAIYSVLNKEPVKPVEDKKIEVKKEDKKTESKEDKKADVKKVESKKKEEIQKPEEAKKATTEDKK